jgi:phage shock protein A
MTSLLSRIREMVSAHAHHSLDEVENPNVMAQQLLRDLSQDIHNAQRALVTALGVEKQLGRQRDQLLGEAADWERKAERLLLAANELLARGAIEKAVNARTAAAALTKPLDTARKSAERMREQVARLKSEWETARNRCAQIGANQAAAEAMGAASRATDHYTSAMNRAQRFDQLANKAGRFEAEMEAASELLGEQGRFDQEVTRVDQAAEVDAAMTALKSRLAPAATTAPAQNS